MIVVTRSPQSFPITFSHAFLVSLVLSVSLCGCGNDSTAPAQPSILQGTVTAGGIPVAGVYVQARWGNQEESESRTDADGKYSLSLNPGRYLLFANEYPCSREGVPIERRLDAEPITIGREPAFLDIRGARLSVTASAPESYPLDLYCLLMDEGFGLISRCEQCADSVRFEFPFIPPGVYAIGIGWEYSHRPWIWLPGVARRDDGERFPVPADRPVHVRGSLPVLARITGSVQGSWLTAGLPTYPPMIEAVGSDSEFVGAARASEDGSFALDFLAETVRLRIRMFPVRRWLGGSDFEHASTFEPHPGEVIEVPPILESGIRVHVERPGSTMEPNVSVSVANENGESLGSGGAMTGNPFLIPNFAPGAYRIRIGPMYYDTWLGQWYDGARSLEAATPIVINGEGIVVDVTFRVTEGGMIRGRIMQADGRAPSQGHTIIARDFEPPYYDRPGKIEQYGRFEVGGLYDGDYYLMDYVRDGTSYLIWYYPGTLNSDEALKISIRNHEDVSGIEWVVPVPSL